MFRGTRRALAAGSSAWVLVTCGARAAELDLSPAEVAAERERLASAGFELMLERQQRLTRVHSQIRTHGAALCGEKLGPVLGIVAYTWNQLPEAFREPAYVDYGVGDLVVVTWVMPGYPAALAGVRRGDTILEIDGRETHAAGELDGRSPTNFAETTALRIERGGRVIDLVLQHRNGCFRPAEVRVFGSIDAHTDGVRIVVYSGMLRFLTSDDELAVILAHQLAHDLIAHDGSGVDLEIEADTLGLSIAARAGYDVSVASGLWQRLGREFPLASEMRAGYPHPISTERALALDATTRVILDAQRRGAPLAPGPQ